MRRAVAALALCAAFFGTATAQPPPSPERALAAVVGVKARAVKGARTAEVLGAERAGSGVLVRPDAVLTIGYLVIEAETVEVTGADGRVVPATLAGFDPVSGFGVLRLLAPLAAQPIALGDAQRLAEREPALAVPCCGSAAASLVYVVSRRPFAGSWEYHLDSAIYTYPPVPNWSGAALIGVRGELLGVGSLLVSDVAGEGRAVPGNLFVPVDLVAPVLDELLEAGRRAGPARPWLGMNTEELGGRLVVVRVAPEGPAERAGIAMGDVVLAVAGEEVRALAEFYRRVWALGPAGVEVPLKVLQGGRVRELVLRSIDRLEHLRPRPTY